mgnify:CR=1 FL=1
MEEWGPAVKAPLLGQGDVGPDGCMYFPPLNGNRIFRLSIGDETMESVGPELGDAAHQMQFSVGLFGVDGAFYMVPYCASDVIRYDIYANEIEKIGSFPTSGDWKWRGAASGMDGNIYGIPDCVGQVLRIDVMAHTVSTFGSDLKAYAGGVLFPTDGCIYCIPLHADTILCIDPATRSTSTFGSVEGGHQGGTFKYEGGCIGSDGAIYACPFAADHVLRIEPITKELSLVGNSLAGHGNAKFNAAVLGADGAIYCVPRSAKQMLRIDCSSKSHSLYGPEFGKDTSWNGAVCAKDGCVYCPPMTSGKSFLRLAPPKPKTWFYAGWLSAPTGAQVVRDHSNWSSFLSYKQQDQNDGLTMMVHGLLPGGIERNWLDKFASDRSTAGMVAGVDGTSVFVAFISPSYFSSKFCCLELQMAMRKQKKCVLVFNQSKNTIQTALSWVPSQLAFLLEAEILPLHEDVQICRACVASSLRRPIYQCRILTVAMPRSPNRRLRPRQPRLVIWGRWQATLQQSRSSCKESLPRSRRKTPRSRRKTPRSRRKSATLLVVV